MNVRVGDWVYLFVGLLGTWWVNEYQTGGRPEIQVMWWVVKSARAVRLAALKVEYACVAAIDRELE